MAWRSQGITGSNNIPLGRRRFAGEEEEVVESRTATPSSMPDGPKRGRSPLRGMSHLDEILHTDLILTIFLYSRARSRWH